MIPEFVPAPVRQRLPIVVAALAAALSGPGPAAAATASRSSGFDFVHTGSVSSGLLSIGGQFTNATSTTAPALLLAKFDPALGRLTGVTVSANTSTSTFVVAPTGLLSLATAGSATRRLGYTITAGSLSVGDSSEITSTGGTLLTLLSLGGGDIGGAALAKSTQFTAANELAQFVGAGSFSVTLGATDTLSVFTLVSVLDGAGLAGSGRYAGTVGVVYQYTPWTLGGNVYKDADHDGFRGAAEPGTGLALYAKLLSVGVVTQVVAVDLATGFYSFSASKGSYRVVIDDNASPGDATPLQLPNGWSSTQASSLARDVTLAGDLTAQDFGLVQAATVSGRVFVDDGAGGGAANDGMPNGAEASAIGQSVELLDAGGSRLDRATTGGDGSYRLFIPATVAAGNLLRVRQAADASTLATGAGLGNTGGSFDRATRSVTFAVAAARDYTGVNFGRVPVPTLSGGGTQAGLPGTSLLRAHRLLATSSGQVMLSAAPLGAASSDDPSAVLYLDANGNGRVDVGELPITGSLNVAAGDSVAVLLRLAIPAQAAAGAHFATALRATMTFADAAPALSTSFSVVDETVVSATGGFVRLIKSVDKQSAPPGTSLTYTVTFTNPGTEAVKDFSIADMTPTFTTMLAVGAIALPAGLESPVVSTPAIGTAGLLRWSFGGQLLPNASGSVQFTVLIAPP